MKLRFSCNTLFFTKKIIMKGFLIIMNGVLKELNPKRFFKFFEEICDIPHGSGNEAALASYLEKFAHDREIFCIRDSVNNVLMRINASAGMESAQPILIQGHIDMVCEKNSGTVHDFEKDPLDLRISDGWVYANGTTLGADDGTAVAVMLALMDEPELVHPEMEFLFTTGEETGLIGAKNFDYSLIKSKILINLDTDNESEVIASCAGGQRSRVIVPLENQISKQNNETIINLSISGLAGGHSGGDIHLGRANANKLMGRILNEILSVSDVRIAGISGGNKDNAIPRECICKFAVPAEKYDSIVKIINKISSEIKEEVCAEDKNIKIDFSKSDENIPALDSQISANLIRFICSIQNGVIEMDKSMTEMVETSSNLGVIEQQSDMIRLTISSRSSIESRLDQIANQIEALCELAGFSVSHDSRYPGWAFKSGTPLQNAYIDTYKKLYPKLCPPEVKAIHAGLECGIIKGHIPDMDIISTGMTVKNIHTPEEKLNIASAERIYNLVKYIVSAL